MADIKHVQVKLDAPLADWFDANCPFSKQDFIEQCFKMLQAAVVLGKLPHPGVYAAHSAIQAHSTLTETEVDRGPDAVRSQPQET